MYDVANRIRLLNLKKKEVLGLHLLDDDDDYDKEIEAVDFVKELYVEEKMVELAGREGEGRKRLEEVKAEKRPFYDVMRKSGLRSRGPNQPDGADRP